MLVENSSDGFQVVNNREQCKYKKRASGKNKRRIPLMTKMDYSLSNSSESDEERNNQLDEG